MRSLLAVFAAGLTSAAASDLECFRDLAAKGVASCDLYPAGKVPGEVAGEFGPEIHKQETYGDISYYNVTVPQLLPFVVPGSDSAFVVAPGGGYEWLAFAKEGLDIARWLNSLGMSAFVMKYRVPQRKALGFGGAALMDAQRALGLVRYHAKELGLNASKIGFIGFSAGGHLTAHISNNNTRRSYPAVDAADGAPCRPDFAVLGYPWAVEVNGTLDLAVLPSNHTPPSFLFHAFDDPTAPVFNSLMYATALKNLSAPGSELHVFPEGGHGFGVCRDNPPPNNPNWAACGWPDLAAVFLRHLRVAPAPALALV